MVYGIMTWTRIEQIIKQRETFSAIGSGVMAYYTTTGDYRVELCSYPENIVIGRFERGELFLDITDYGPCATRLQRVLYKLFKDNSKVFLGGAGYSVERSKRIKRGL